MIRNRLRNRAWAHAVLLVAAISCFLACGGGRALRGVEENVREWTVFDSDGYEAMVFSDKPGPVTSSASPPPGFPAPANHPFLSGFFTLANYESEISEVLRESNGVEDFIRRLRSKGFEVRESE